MTWFGLVYCEKYAISGSSSSIAKTVNKSAVVANYKCYLLLIKLFRKCRGQTHYHVPWIIQIMFRTFLDLDR